MSYSSDLQDTKDAIASLKEARNLISNDQKWTKGCLARSANDSALSYLSSEAEHFCSFGAAMRAAEKRNNGSGPYQLHGVVIYYLNKALHTTNNEHSTLRYFNDDPDVTHEDVLALYQIAIDYAEADLIVLESEQKAVG